MWLCDLKKCLEAISREVGHLGMVVAKVIGNYGNIDIYFTSGEKWIYIPETDEIIKTEKDWRKVL